VGILLFQNALNEIFHWVGKLPYDSPPGGYPAGTEALMVLFFVGIPTAIIILIVVAFILLSKIREKLK